MPISPQIVITPEDIAYKSFDISAVTKTSSTATYTAVGHTFSSGDIVMITGLAPDGYNGTYTITSVATNTFTVANTTNTALTDQSGNAYWSDPTEYEYNGGQAVAYIPDNDDVNTIVDNNATVANAAAEAAQAQAAADLAAADAAFALTAAGNAQTTADGKNKIYRQATAPTGTLVAGDLWYDTSTGNKPYRYSGSAWVSVQDDSIAIALNTANAAQTTANGKNKITYSSTTPGSTANTAGDLWWQFSGGNVIAQWTGVGGTSWTSNQLASAVIASIDAGKITAGTISVAISLEAATITGGSINIGSGVFQVSTAGAVTITSGSININSSTFILSSAGKLTCSDVVITGGTLTIGTKFSVSNTGVLTASGGQFTGKIVADSGWIGAETTGWNFTSSGYIRNYDGTSIFYPTSGSNTYLLITDRSISANSFQASGSISVTGTGNITTGTGVIQSNGQNSNRNYFSYYNTISLQSISGGYGIDSDWAPNSDNTYNLGQATSAGYGANRRWQRLYSNNTTISTSDVRLKTDVSDSPLGLDFINAIRPVNYRWITGRQEVVKDADGNGIIIGETAEGKPIFEMQAIPGQRLHYGFIAQEVKAVLDASGVEDFAGWVQDDVSDPDSTQSLSYEQFIAPLTKAVQELSARVKQLEGK